MSINSMQIQQSPWKVEIELVQGSRSLGVDTSSQYLSKEGTIELDNKWTIIAPHDNLQVHQQLLLLLLFHCGTNSLQHSQDCGYKGSRDHGRVSYFYSHDCSTLGVQHFVDTAKVSPANLTQVL